MRVSDPFDLDGKVAIVTGSTRGIGRAIAERFAERGARVVVSSRTAADAERVAAELRASGAEAIGIAAHVGKPAELDALVDGAVAAFGGIDVLVCNAAVNPYFGPLGAIPDDAYERIMEGNVRSALRLANRTFPLIAERGGGAAIFVSSIVALSGTATLGAYGVSKAALVALARSLAVEWGGRGIRVNCLLPGVVRTAFARALWDDPAIAEPALRRTPLGRLGEPDDVAGAAVFLAADAGRYVTGASIVIDGGMTIAGGL